MSTLPFAAGTAVVVLYVLRARMLRALAVTVAVTLLIPGGLLAPAATSSYLTIHRLILIAFVLNLIVRIRRGEVETSALRPTPLHIALLAYAAVTFVVGVVLGDRLVPVSVSLFSWVFIVDQLVVFTSVLIVTRAVGGPSRIAHLVGALVTVLALVAIFEHFTGESYGRWFFTTLTDQRVGAGSAALATRGGDVRVRAAIDFPLAYAWVATIALPFVAATASRAGRVIAILAPGVVALSILWTYARSAYVGAAAGMAVLVLGSRFDRKLVRIALVGAAAALLIVGPTAAIQRTFQARETQASDARRTTRAPLVLEQAAQEPFTGIGFATLATRGETSTDSSWLQTYVALGIIGAVSFALLLLVAVREVLPGLRAPPGLDLSLAAAVVAALLGGAASAAFVDSFSVSAFYRILWILAAFGVAIAERVSPPAIRVPVPGWRSVWLPAAGAAAGMLVWILAPVTGAQTFVFQTISIRTDVRGGANEFIGRTYLNTACVAMEQQAVALQDTRVSCVDRRTFGTGLARIEAPGDVLLRRVRAVTAAARASVRGFRPAGISLSTEAKPSWARTAPVWGAGVGLGLALMLSRGFRRRLAPFGAGPPTALGSAD